jgi:superfamily I DNA/RNA helicase
MPAKALKLESECENCAGASDTLIELDAELFPHNWLGRKHGVLKICVRCNTCYEARRQATADIVSFDAPKKLIVAGPGTGKSFTFCTLLEHVPREKPVLVFTFINNLVDELERDLAGLKNDQIRVNTLHGFCKESLHKTIRLNDVGSDFEYFPPLTLLVERDAGLLGLRFQERDFQRDLVNLKEQTEAVKFYLHQAAYYNAVSYDDSVYRVFSFYRANPNDVPNFEIIIVDEFQDFNLLEASFVRCLAAKNKIVIAGDDDQSLYRFRHASNKYLRELWESREFANFSLPFCSRCPPVLVDGVNAFIDNAQGRGLLQGRISPRDFKCYWPDKHREHDSYPHILVADCSMLKTACEFVREQISITTRNEGLNGTEKDIQFLVIGPESGYHLKQVQNCLAAALDSSVFEIQATEKKERLIIEQGYSMLNKKRNLNLGWRIVLECDPLPEPADVVRKAYESGKPISDLLPAGYLEKHETILNEPAKVQEAQEEEKETSQRVRVKLTNFYGSKGLSALHTIVIGLNDGVFPEDPHHLNDDEACKFIVALTRARRSCCLVYNGEFRKEAGAMIKRQSEYIQLLPAATKREKKYKIKSGLLVQC